MADTLTARQRSALMSRVRGRGNKSTEVRLIALMRASCITGWRRGVPLPGKPDFVFRKQKVAMFVDGCFWHGCSKHGRLHKSNVVFWRRKLAANQARDRLVTRTLRRAGWRVLRIWEHELKSAAKMRLARRILNSLS